MMDLQETVSSYMVTYPHLLGGNQKLTLLVKLFAFPKPKTINGVFKPDTGVFAREPIALSGPHFLCWKPEHDWASFLHGFPLRTALP